MSATLLALIVCIAAAALEWGKSPDDFLTLSQLALTCSTLGKSASRRDLTLPQNMPKFFHGWIKSVDKGRAPQWFNSARARSTTAENLARLCDNALAGL